MRTAREIFIRAAEHGNAIYNEAILAGVSQVVAEDVGTERAVAILTEDWNEAFAERDDRIQELEECVGRLIELCAATRLTQEKLELLESAKQLINQNNEQNTSNS